MSIWRMLSVYVLITEQRCYGNSGLMSWHKQHEALILSLHCCSYQRALLVADKTNACVHSDQQRLHAGLL